VSLPDAPIRDSLFPGISVLSGWAWPRAWVAWFSDLTATARGSLQAKDGFTGDVQVTTPTGTKTLSIVDGQIRGVS
jgi:hypothetical protein